MITDDWRCSLSKITYGFFFSNDPGSIAPLPSLSAFSPKYPILHYTLDNNIFSFTVRNHFSIFHWITYVRSRREFYVSTMNLEIVWLSEYLDRNICKYWYATKRLCVVLMLVLWMLAACWMAAGSLDEFEMDTSLPSVVCRQCVQLWRVAAKDSRSSCGPHARTCTGNACFMR